MSLICPVESKIIQFLLRFHYRTMVGELYIGNLHCSSNLDLLAMSVNTRGSAVGSHSYLLNIKIAKV